MADFDQIARTHGSLIRRIARSYEANGARAEELVQDIHLALWQALPRFRGEASVKTFVARVAHNRAISHVAREAREPRVAPLDEALRAPEATPEENVTRTDLRAKLEAAVQRLPVGLKVAATLALEGFSPEDVAEVLGIGVSAASVRLYRAKEQLKEMLKGSVT
ncbi:MAG: sigma-70 family RNA polymerase sigma factor [Alphaproteobacteria bacterium]|nr:sigma-70 family RNA polymerase sigma factor [Alphaproteobacteria bacterium]